METIWLLASDSSERTEFLNPIIRDHYKVEMLSDTDRVLDAVRSRSGEIFALIIDCPSENPRAQELIDYVTNANSYLFAIPILILTDAAHRDSDEAFLSDTVIAAIEIGQSPRSVLHKIQKSNVAINSFSFQEFSRMLKALPSLIYLKDTSARYVFCSQYWHHLAHYDEENWTICGKTDYDIRKDMENARAAFESDMRIIESDKGLSYVIEENDDGIQEFLQIIKEPVHNSEGKVSGIIAIINNVTEQEKLRRELKQKSVTDELTGLYNRMYYDEFISHLEEKLYPLGIISADCDGLKTINDLYGHPVGDEYIRMAATLLNSVLPDDSVKFRTGGDEFLVIIPHTDEKTLRGYLDQLQSTSRMFSIKDRSLSVSFGSAVVKSPTDSIKDNVTRSDREMYRNKKAKESWM